MTSYCSHILTFNKKSANIIFYKIRLQYIQRFNPENKSTN